LLPHDATRAAARETYYWGNLICYYDNPWANDGSQYVGRKYKLGAVLYSQTPENHPAVPDMNIK